jgi:hypothetical protein
VPSKFSESFISLVCRENCLLRVDSQSPALLFEDGAVFSSDEEDTVYKILTSDGRDVTLAKMEGLVYNLEQDLFQSMTQLNKIEKREEDLVIGGLGGKVALVNWSLHPE